MSSPRKKVKFWGERNKGGLIQFILYKSLKTPFFSYVLLSLIAIMPPLFLFLFSFFHNKKSCGQSYLFNLIRHSQVIHLLMSFVVLYFTDFCLIKKIGFLACQKL